MSTSTSPTLFKVGAVVVLLVGLAGVVALAMIEQVVLAGILALAAVLFAWYVGTRGKHHYPPGDEEYARDAQARKLAVNPQSGVPFGGGNLGGPAS